MECIFHCNKCDSPSTNCFKFPCNHLLCCNCLYRSLLQDQLNELIDSNILQIKCCDQTMQISLLQIRNILKEIIQSNHQIEPFTSYIIYDTIKDSYCFECKTEFCRDSDESLHVFHKYIILAEDFKHMSLIGWYDYLYEIEGKFMEESSELLLVNEERGISEGMLTKCERICLLLSIMKLLYSKYNSDIKKSIYSIPELIFLNQVKLCTPIVNATLGDKNTFGIDELPDSFSCTQTITGDIGIIHSLVQLMDSRIVSGSSDNLIRIWEMKKNSFKCTNILTKHTEPVYCLLVLKDGRLVSGSGDKTIRIWEVTHSSFNCSQILNFHTEWVYSLVQLQDGRIVSGSWDNTIVIWAPIGDTFFEMQSLTFSSWVSSIIQLKDGRLVSGNENRTVTIWKNINHNFEISQSFCQQTKHISSLLELKDLRLATGSADCTIAIWESKENSLFSCTLILKGHTGQVSSLVQLADGIIASASGDKTIKLWEVHRNYYICTKTLIGHDLWVDALLLLKDGKLISGSYDKTIRIWEKSVEKNKPLEKKENCLTF